MKIFSARLYPLIFLQVYLILTLAIFQFGPVYYNIPNALVFWLLMACYLLSYFLGYLFSLADRSVDENADRSVYAKKACSARVGFNVSCFQGITIVLAFVSCVLSFKGAASAGDLMNPKFWIYSALEGILSPGDAYSEKMQRVASDAVGNKALSIALFFISFSKILIIPATVFLWRRLSIFHRVISIYVSMLPVFSALAAGTNKAVFDFVIFYGFSLLVYFVYSRQVLGRFFFASRKFFLISIFACGFGALAFFGTAMGARGGDIAFIEQHDPLNNIRVSEEARIRSDESFSYYTYAWLATYVVQGYYGLSISLSEEFESTFGVGNSVFLMRNFESLLGVNISDRTFQKKIDRYWGELTHWHSFYSHFANDFSFPGVVAVCFFLSFMIGKVWISFLATGNIFAGALMSVFGLLVIFIPANNQVFGFLDGLSAFVFLSALWYVTRKNPKYGLRNYI